MKIIKYLGGVLLALSMVQCTTQNEEHGHAHGEQEVHEEEEGTVTLSKVQIANAGIKTHDSFDTMNVSGYIRANGIFDLPPENVASITAPMQGTVTQVNYLVGSRVEKGAVLAVLKHPDYIKLQEEYMTTVYNLGYLREEYLRQQKLDSANISSRKAFRQAEMNYNSARASKLSLEKQLQYIGIAPSRVAGGKISSSISVRAPFSGFVTKLNVHRGQFVNPQQELYELINKDHMHIELNVYEKDIQGVKKGQPLVFTVPSLGPQRYEGYVFLVGHSFDQQTKTIRVHGHIEQMQPEFIRGLYLEASIFTGTEKVRALPVAAVVRDDGKNYIFIQQQEAAGHDEAHAEGGLHPDDPDDPHADEHEHQHQHTEEHDEPHVNEHEHHTEEHDDPQVNEHQHQHPEEQESPHSSEHGHEEGTVFRQVEVVTGLSRNGMVEIRSVEKLAPHTRIVTQGAYDIFAEMKKGEGGHHH